MNIDGIESSQIENLKTPFLDSQAQTAVQEKPPAEVKAETEKLAQLTQQVQDLPENRPDVVERGRDLLADPNYPSADVEEQVASILLGESEEVY